jgi:ribosomal protein S18 acetylase RimI-like enzyme
VNSIPANLWPTNLPQFILRRATPDDAAAIAALTDAAYAKYIPLIGRQPQPMTADYRLMAAEHPIWLLYLDDEIPQVSAPALAGLLVLEFEPETALIYSLAVHPDLQGRGLGRHLLALAEQEALQAGYRKIRLYTNEHFIQNIALYRRLGYQETAREPYLGTDLVHMSKVLDE